MTSEKLNTDWTPDLIAELVRLWNDGCVTSEIGRRLGVSKNAVISKAHRLHLAGRPSPIRLASSGPRRRPAYPSDHKRTAADPQRKVAAPVPRDPVAEVQALNRFAAMKLGAKPCTWPIGHPDEPGFHFCGDKSVDGRAYCPDHCALAYVGAPAPKKAVA